MHLLSLVRNMPKHRFDVTVAFFKEEAWEARSLVPDFKKLGVRVMNLDMSHRWDIFALWRLYRLVRKNSFDILHTHLFRADVCGPPIAALVGIPVVITTVHNTESFFQNPVVKLVLRIVTRCVNQVIAISQAVENCLIQDIGLCREKVRVIYYGIEVEPDENESPTHGELLRRKLNIPVNARVIGTVGRLARQKGQRYLIEAFAHVHEEHTDTRLLIVGHDDEGLRPELESLAAQLGIKKAVLLPGYINGREALGVMDLFVLPSLWEGLGLVLLEAMLAQLPIVATKVGAVPEIVPDGGIGLLVPPSDSDALAQAIEHLLENPDRASGMGRCGREQVLQRFSMDKMVGETVALYDKLMSKGKRVRST